MGLRDRNLCTDSEEWHGFRMAEPFGDGESLKILEEGSAGVGGGQ